MKIAIRIYISLILVGSSLFMIGAMIVVEETPKEGWSRDDKLSEDENNKNLIEYLRSLDIKRPEYPKPMLPPWQAYPGPKYYRFSMGWRMGGGEDYRHEFDEWFRSLSKSEQQEHIDEYPEPDGWGETEDYRGFWAVLLGADVKK